MGRGLSNLQKTILRLALENREALEYKQPPLSKPLDCRKRTKRV